MPPREPQNADLSVVLLTGASGYVGGRMLPLLEHQPVVLRCLARNPEKLQSLVKESAQIVQGDVFGPDVAGWGCMASTPCVQSHSLFPSRCSPTTAPYPRTSRLRDPLSNELSGWNGKDAFKQSSDWFASTARAL